MVNVKLKGVKVNSFSIRDSTVLLEIFFNDGANKQIYRTTTIDDPKILADDIVSEIVSMEKNINLKFDGEKISGDVDVIVENEDEDKKKIVQILSEIQAKIMRIKSKKSADGYMDLVADIQKTEVLL